MVEAERKELLELMVLAGKSRGQSETNDLKRWALPVVIGLTIAFAGWFATKSTQDIENTTAINKTLEFMQLQQSATNEALKEQLDDMKAAFESAVERIDGKLGEQFTRVDFNREMLYRDQDFKRIQNQVEAVLDKLNEKK